MGSDKKPDRNAGEKKNLLFVTSSIYFGGAQKVTYLLATGLSDEFNVTVAYCFDSGMSYSFGEKVRIRKLPEYDRDASFPKKAKCIHKQVKALRALKEELDIDAAVSLGNLPNLINVMSKGSERVICSERSNPKRSWGRWFYHKSRRLFARSDLVVFQSEKIREMYGKRIRAKSCILKNPVLRPEPAREQREKKIVTMGRLVAQKNHALLIRSFAQFRRRFPEYRLVIFGDGELEGKLKRLTADLDLSDAVFLEKNDPDVHKRIRDAEMFVLSSDFEGLSNALLECMSMGIACISTKCEGSVDVIRDRENGLLVDLNDERALSEAMCTLAQDPELRRRLELQAMEDMKEYDKDTVIKDWSRVIRQCFTGSGEETGKRPALLIMCSSLYGGGAERVACRLACGLSGRYQVYMLYIRDKGQTYHLDPDVRTIAMPYFECSSFEDLMEQRCAYVRQLKESLEITASISFMFTMNKLNVRSRGKEKVICSERNNPAKRDPEHIKEIEGIYEAADHVVFQSETVRSLFSGTVRQHSSIILNPVSVSCRRSGTSRRIVNIGRLAPQKDQAMLLRAFAEFHRTHSDYTLSIYGEGELEEELRSLADRLELSDAVQFHGQVREIHPAIADAEFFVLSSDYEGLSNALLECMMMGFPCISTCCEGSVDVIRPGENGILVDVGSEEQMTSAMTLLADNAQLREELGVRARETSERFRTERVIMQWDQLISRQID